MLNAVEMVQIKFKEECIIQYKERNSNISNSHMCYKSKVTTRKWVEMTIRQCLKQWGVGKIKTWKKSKPGKQKRKCQVFGKNCLCTAEKFTVLKE